MIKKLKLTNITCFRKSSFEFSDDINLIIGNNGSGKTTIMEAIAFFSFAKFQSISSDFSAVSIGHDVGRIEAEIATKDSTEIGAVAITRLAKISQINGKKVSNSEMVGFQRAVLFNPETVDLVGGAPDVRRRELNFILCQMDKKFVRTLLEFKNVLKQRNSLLRNIAEGRSKIAELDFWDKEFVGLANLIRLRRTEVVALINKNISKTHSSLTGGPSDLSIRLNESADYSRFDEALVIATEGDVRSGTTSIGPHRDDFSFMVHARQMKDFSSRGEQRLAALALKIESGKILSENSSVILILDDVFSELDFEKRELLAKNLPEGQILVSATDELVVPNIFKKREKIISL
jgi:DNA replication and repair protein RecF